MGAGSGEEGREGVLRVRGRLGQGLTAQAGSSRRVGAPSRPHHQEWFLTSSCHRPLCPCPTGSSEPSPRSGARTPHTAPGMQLRG